MELSGRRKQRSPRRLSEDMDQPPVLNEQMNPTENNESSSVCHLCKYEFAGPGQLAIHLRYVHQQIAQLSPKDHMTCAADPGGQRSEVTESQLEMSLYSQMRSNHVQDSMYADDENAARRRMYVQSSMPDDRYIYCEECKERYEGECPMHPFTVIEDKPVPPECPDRARLTLPDFLSIRPSGIPGVGDGVWAEKHIPKGVRFGPYAGEIVSNDAGYWSGYAWEICVQGRVIHCVDGKNENKSNWLRYINCARSLTEQSLVAFQYMGEIYYHTCKPIEPGTELLVYYGEEFAKKLDVISELTSLMFDPKSSTYKCEFCGRMYTIAIYLARHLRYTHNKVIKSGSAVHQAVKSIDRESLAAMVAEYAEYSQRAQEAMQAGGQRASQYDTNKGASPSRYDADDVRGDSPSQFSDVRGNSPGVDSKGHLQGEYEPEPAGMVDGGEETGSYLPRNLNAGGLDEGLEGDGRQDGGDDDDDVVEVGTESKAYECGVCGEEFDLELVYNAHMITHSVVDGHQCDMCGDLFPTGEELGAHACMLGIRVEENHDGDSGEDASKPYQCSICNKRFREKEYLRTHVRIHTGEKPYQCRFCKKSFTQGSARNSHERTHTKLKPFACDVPNCGMRFRDSSHLRMHKRIHVDNRPFQCRFCGKCYLFASQLLQHELTHGSQKPYVCGVCNRGFNQKAYLRVHERLHTGEKPYPCRVCGKRFSQMTSRNVHEQKHGNWGMYDCKKCGLSFKRSRDLLRHECHALSALNGVPPMHPQQAHHVAPVHPAHPALSMQQPMQPNHMQQQVFPCKKCPEVFPTSSDLQQHQQKHVLRPYACNICSKRFTHRSYLEIHIRIHTGEKPYACKYCGKTFSQTSSRNAHERIHERIKAKREAERNAEQSAGLNQQDTAPAQQVPVQQFSPEKAIENSVHVSDMPGLIPTERSGPIPSVAPGDPMGQAMHACRYCNKTFRDPALVMRHEQSHLHPRDHVCGFCGKCFSKGRYLQIHERTHTGEKPYQCRYCTKRFTQGSSRNVHERIHVRNGDQKLDPLSPINNVPPISPTQFAGPEGMPPSGSQGEGGQGGLASAAGSSYFCRYCNLQFSDTAALAHHEKVHGIRPFICSFCGRTFTQSRYLQIHVRTHVGEQPYPCRFCNKRFSQCSARNMHERIHTEFRPHQCPVCGQSFIVNSALQKHMQKHRLMTSMPVSVGEPAPQASMITL